MQCTGGSLRDTRHELHKLQHARGGAPGWPKTLLGLVLLFSSFLLAQIVAAILAAPENTRACPSLCLPQPLASTVSCCPPPFFSFLFSFFFFFFFFWSCSDSGQGLLGVCREGTGAVCRIFLFLVEERFL